MSAENSMSNKDRDAINNAFEKMTLVIYDTCKQGKFCRGVCHRLENNPPVGQPKYLNHVFCSVCGQGDGVWMKKEDANGLYCKCCKRRVRTKNFKQ